MNIETTRKWVLVEREAKFLKKSSVEADPLYDRGDQETPIKMMPALLVSAVLAALLQPRTLEFQ